MPDSRVRMRAGCMAASAWPRSKTCRCGYGPTAGRAARPPPPKGAYTPCTAPARAASAALYAVIITENRRAVHITGQENAALQMLFGFLTAAVFIGIRDRGFAVNIRPDDRG